VQLYLLAEHTKIYFNLICRAFKAIEDFFRRPYLGLDLKNLGNQTHFFGHDFHSANHNNTEFPKLIKMMEYGAQLLSDSGIKIYNCSPIAKLNGIPYIDFNEALFL